MVPVSALIRKAIETYLASLEKPRKKKIEGQGVMEMDRQQIAVVNYGHLFGRIL